MPQAGAEESKREIDQEQLDERPKTFTSPLGFEDNYEEEKELDSELEAKDAESRAIEEKALQEAKDIADQKAFRNVIKRLLKEKKELSPELKKELADPAVLNGFLQLQRGLRKQGLNFNSLNLEFNCISEDKAAYQQTNKIISTAPGMLICTNASIEPIHNLSSLIHEALGPLNKIRLVGHIVNGQPVLIYHANSGENKKAARFFERKVLNSVIKALLDEGYPNVTILAQTHQPAYQVTKDKKGLESKDGHMVWSDGLYSLFSEFANHDISQFATSEEVVYKPRGLFDEHGNFIAPDGFNDPQVDKDGRPDWAANMMIWTARRPVYNNNQKQSNTDRLAQKQTPLSKQVLDYSRQDTDFFAHRPVKLINEFMTWILAGDTSRKGIKAFKNPHEVYNHSAFTTDDKLKPEVEQARIQSTIQLYILAANHFARVNKEQLSEIQREKLEDLLKTMPLANNQRIPQLTNKSFRGFKDPEAINKFVIALNELINAQIHEVLPPDFTPPERGENINSLGAAWQAALYKWSDPKFGVTSGHFSSLMGYVNTNSPKSTKAPKKHPALMNPLELRALSASDTIGGGSDPLHVLFGAFGLELYGGYSSINGSSIETNESIGQHQLFAKAWLMIQSMFSSTNPVFMAVTEGADEQVSDIEKENPDHAPSKALPRMVRKLVEILKLCDELCPSFDPIEPLKPSDVSPTPKPAPIEQKQAPKGHIQQTKIKFPPTVIKMSLDITIELDRLHQDPTCKYKEPLDPRKFETWSATTKNEYFLFLNYCELAAALIAPKDKRAALSKERSDLLFDIGHAILRYQELKTACSLRDNFNVDKDIDWKKINMDMKELTKDINGYCEAIKKRNWGETFGAFSLALAGIVVFAASAALLVFAFGGIPILTSLLLATTELWITPLAAAVGVLGMAVSNGIYNAYKRGFFHSKPKAELSHFADEIKQQFNNYDAEFKRELGASSLKSLS